MKTKSFSGRVSPEEWENFLKEVFEYSCSASMFATEELFFRMNKHFGKYFYNVRRQEGEYNCPYGDLELFPCAGLYGDTIAYIVKHENLETVFREYLQQKGPDIEVVLKRHSEYYLENLCFIEEKPEKGKIDIAIEQLKDLKKSL